MAFRETDFIAWVTEGATNPLPGLLAGPGDDAAVFADGRALAVDAVVEGVHFATGTPAGLVTGKALARPLSDLCAMGALGEWVFVAALLPPGSDGPALAAGLRAAAQRHGVRIAGGDTKRTATGALAFAVTAVGRCAGARPWMRGGGRAGDRLLVSGPLGGAAGGRHLRPRPRRDVVEALVAAGTDVHACIDLSDGLARNLRLLCGASRLGARIRAADIPVHGDVAAGRDGVEAALGDGEDYELLLALAPDAAAPPGLHAIGELTADPRIVLGRDGAEEPWPALGYEHEF